jgi:hypothetical protein
MAIIKRAFALFVAAVAIAITVQAADPVVTSQGKSLLP